MFGIGKSKRLQQQLQELTDRLTVLTKHVEELSRSDAHRARVNIEKLEVDQAFLDQLVFRLESLDIEELSGSLNLGNNFSPKVESGADADRQVKPDTSPQESSGTRNEGDADSAVSEPAASADTTVTLPDGKSLKATDTGYLMTL